MHKTDESPESTTKKTETTEVDQLRKENERLKRHLMDVDIQWEEAVSELKAENDFLHEENASLKDLVSKNAEAEKLTLAMAEMERGYERQIHALQKLLRESSKSNSQISHHQNVFRRDEDVIEKSIVRGLLQVLLDKKQRPDAQEQALRVLCEAVGIPAISKIKSAAQERPKEGKEVGLEGVGLSDLWIAYLMEKTK